MRRTTRWLLATAVAIGALALLERSPQRAAAQPIPARGHIWLPPSWGATPASARIHAEAAYIAAAGDFLESASIARRHNALAAKQEMENALQWVDTYFEMRARNRAWREIENPNHLTREKMHQDAMARQIEEFFQNSLDNNLTEKLNWLLNELSDPALAYEYQAGDKSLADGRYDQKLGPRDVGHLLLTDGGGSGGRKLVFRADKAKVLETDWPYALRGSEFDAVRAHFESTRDLALKELQAKGRLSREQEQALIEAIDRVRIRFNEVYTRETRLEGQWQRPGSYSDYLAGRRFVQSLAAGVFRALSTNDRSVFDGSYKFTGDSAVDLMLHMYQNGLEFAPPEPGDEATYKKLFLAMRELYLNLAPRSSGVGSNP